MKTWHLFQATPLRLSSSYFLPRTSLLALPCDLLIVKPVTARVRHELRNGLDVPLRIKMGGDRSC